MIRSTFIICLIGSFGNHIVYVIADIVERDTIIRDINNTSHIVSDPIVITVFTCLVIIKAMFPKKCFQVFEGNSVKSFL